MFQNINENTIKMERNLIFSIFSKKNILVYIISFLLSLVSISEDFSIFSISMLGACFASSVPALGVIIVSLIGNLIKYGVGGATAYFITTLILTITLFIAKPMYNESERNEKIKVGKNVFISVILIQIIKFAMSSFTTYDVLSGIILSIMALIFYKIFVNSIVVLQDLNMRKAFSIEELVGASLLLAIAIGAFGNVNIYGIQIKNVLSILIVMILGWKNGILVGTTTGVTVGITLGIITGSEPIMIAAYAISGMIAGILSRFGKIGVVIGFTLGNIILAYVSNGYTVELIHFKEILIASIGLLAIPNNFKINLEEFIGNEKFLPITSDKTLNKSKEVAENLNQVSEAIQEMASTYKQEENKELEQPENETNKQIFITELLNNLEPYKTNILYEDIANVNGPIIEKIFQTLLEKQEINRETLLKIFAECNSYIVGFNDKEISNYLEENITQMVRTINTSYKVSKSDFIWRKKVEENNKNMGKQLNQVSRAIKKMAKGIEEEIENESQYEKEKSEIMELIKQKSIKIEDLTIKKSGRYIIEVYLKNVIEPEEINTIEKLLTKTLKEKIVLNGDTSIGRKLNFLSDDKFEMSIATSDMTKSKSEVSGDSFLNIRLKDGKYLVALSDGMGTGKLAKESSMQVLRMLENLLLSGFDKEISIDLINTALMNQSKEIFATMDIAIVDLYEGNIEFIKSGACPTYIKNKKNVQIIKAESLPTGIVGEHNIQTLDKDIASGDIMVMCSDGILDANIEYKNKELWVKYVLEDIETTNTKKVSSLLINEAIDNNFGVVKDDMSVIACKFIKK